MAATETQRGLAKVFAMDGAVLTGAAQIGASFENADIEGQMDEDDVKGQNGDVETIITSNKRYSVTVQFAPTAASRSAAISAATAGAGLLDAIVTLSGFSIAEFNTAWNCVGFTGKMVNSTYYVMTLKLIKHVTNSGTGSNKLQGAAVT